MIDRVQSFYDSHVDAEWDRLTRGLSAVEFATTLQLIKKYFPLQGHVVDIGGGPGRYTIELARLGYKVTLFDLSPQLLSRAAFESKQAGLIFQAIVQGNATDLRVFKTDEFQAALMLGPLLHLTSRSERLAALGELRRILMPGAVAIVSYLNSWGLIRTGLTDFQSWYDSDERIMQLLHDQAFEDKLAGFTDCYWSTPPTAISEVREAGFTIMTYAGAESFLSGMAGVLDGIRQSNKARYNKIINLATAMAEQPQYRDSTDHLTIVLQSE